MRMLRQSTPSIISAKSATITKSSLLPSPLVRIRLYVMYCLMINGLILTVFRLLEVRTKSSISNTFVRRLMSI